MQWAKPDPSPIPPAPPGADQSAHVLREIARRANTLAKAIEDSAKLCDRRGALPPGASRAAITTANAKWARAAEHRDHCAASFELALETGGFTK